MEITHITPESRVGEIAASHPLATRVLARHGIDFCCGGGATLRQAGAKRGLSVERLIDEIEEQLAGGRGEDSWLETPAEDLVAHIIATFHQPLRAELPRLETMARKVASVHAERDPEGRLPRIVSTLVEFKQELEDHMAREESMLFPALLSGGAADAVGAFVDEHAAAGEKLTRLRALAEDYVVPRDACNTWRALWAGLEDLEATMHEHVHLENNVLFRQAGGAGGG